MTIFALPAARNVSRVFGCCLCSGLELVHFYPLLESVFRELSVLISVFETMTSFVR